MRSWGWGFYDGISAPIRRGINQSLLSLHYVRIQQKVIHLQTRKESAGAWPWTSQPSELWGINVCGLRHPVYGILVMAAWTKTVPILVHILPTRIRHLVSLSFQELHFSLKLYVLFNKWWQDNWIATCKDEIACGLKAPWHPYLNICWKDTDPANTYINN